MVPEPVFCKNNIEPDFGEPNNLPKNLPIPELRLACVYAPDNCWVVIGNLLFIDESK